eukprot:5207850-Ditylum_brightwellii.AAC.1
MMHLYYNEDDKSVHGAKNLERLHSSSWQNGMIAMLAPPPVTLSCWKREQSNSFLHCRDFQSAS